MEIIVPEFARDADNVYRTDYHIVKQRMKVIRADDENQEVISIDTFYKRTGARDAEYESVYSKRKHIDGKRLPSTAYTRIYMD